MSLTDTVGANADVVRVAVPGVTDWLSLTDTVGAKVAIVIVKVLGVTVLLSLVVTVGANVDVVRLAVDGVTLTLPPLSVYVMYAFRGPLAVPPEVKGLVGSAELE